MQCRFFAAGFRPMFLAAGVGALLLLPAWIAVLVYGAPLPSGWPPTLWHAHEMLYGFVAAAIAGFLLTAVPSWTGQRGFAGWPLLVLLGLWVLARLLDALAAAWPAMLVATVDAAFLCVLGALVAPPLVRERNRNTPLLAVLATLVGCNLAFHWNLARHDPEAARRALYLGIDLVLLLVTVIGGRIVPAFTANALRAANSPVRPCAWRGVGGAAIAAMVALALVDLLAPGGRLAAVLALLAALVQALRLAQWRGPRTLGQPILWVLHLGYAWLPLGLALKALASTGGPAWSAFWLHALTIGVLATMILGVMTRAALGHTGRPLRVAAPVTAAYLLLLLAALVRVFGLAVPGVAYPKVLLLSAIPWTAAFAQFVGVYAPILWGPRADGRPA